MERKEGATKYLVPSTLGIGLVHGYNKIGLEKSLSKPQLRREVSLIPYYLCPSQEISFQTERSMVQVCDRAKSKDDMLTESIEQYKDVFILVRRDFERVVQVSGRKMPLFFNINHLQSVRQYIQGNGRPPTRNTAQGAGRRDSDDDDDDNDNNNDPGGSGIRANAGRRGRGSATRGTGIVRGRGAIQNYPRPTEQIAEFSTGECKQIFIFMLKS